MTDPTGPTGPTDPTGPSGPSGPTVAPATSTPWPASRGTTVLENGRAKAYRPLPADARLEALAQALEAYRQGAFFLAHELLEPAWMGASGPLERALHSGLIKVAAAFVHASRDNPAGVAKNLDGARVRLTIAAGADETLGIDVEELLARVDACRDAIASGHEPPPIEIPHLECRVS